jgi:hypothetical protein
LHTDECQAFKRAGSCPLGSACKLKHIEKKEKRKRPKSEGGGSEKKLRREPSAANSDDKLMLHDSGSRLAATSLVSAPAKVPSSLASLMLHAGSIRPSFTSQVSSNTTNSIVDAAAGGPNGVEAPVVVIRGQGEADEKVALAEEEAADEEEQSSSGSDQRITWNNCVHIRTDKDCVLKNQTVEHFFPSFISALFFIFLQVSWWLHMAE